MQNPPRRARRVDANSREILAALRRIGCTVFVIEYPVDCLIWYRGRLTLMEIKNPKGKNKLTVEQEKLDGSMYVVVRTVEEAIDAVSKPRLAGARQGDAPVHVVREESGRDIGDVPFKPAEGRQGDGAESL